mgnify:CR=1 FL=1
MRMDAPAVMSRFGAPRALIGMIHVGALPGTPRAHESIDALVARAVAEARVYRDAGFHALAIENMHDLPYLKGAVGPEIVAAMTVVGREVRREVALPLGVQVFSGQIPDILGVPKGTGTWFEQQWTMITSIPDLNWVTFAFGLGTILIIFGFFHFFLVFFVLMHIWRRLLLWSVCTFLATTRYKQ